MEFYEELVLIFNNDIASCKLLRATGDGRDFVFTEVDRAEEHDSQSAGLSHVITLTSSLGRWFGLSETGRLLSRWYWGKEGFLRNDYYGSHG